VSDVAEDLFARWVEHHVVRGETLDPVALCADRPDLLPEVRALIARYLGADAVRLSPAALETLAIIAYRQPVTRGVIERIRGVDSGHVVRGLLHRRLVHEQGRAETPGRPILYATSMAFMERFGLTSLEDLPPLEADIAARLAQAEADAAEGLLGPVAAAGTDEDASLDGGEPLAEDA